MNKTKKHIMIVVILIFLSINTAYSAEWKQEIRQLDTRNGWLENYQSFKDLFLNNNYVEDQEKIKELFIKLVGDDMEFLNNGFPSEGKIAVYYDFNAAMNILEYFFDERNNDTNSSFFFKSRPSNEQIEQNIIAALNKKETACKKDYYCYTKTIILKIINKGDKPGMISNDFFANKNNPFAEYMSIKIKEKYLFINITAKQ